MSCPACVEGLVNTYMVKEFDLTGTTTLGQRGLESNSNEGVLHIPQSYRNGKVSLDSLVSYPGHLLGGGLTSLQRCSQCIL